MAASHEKALQELNAALMHASRGGDTASDGELLAFINDAAWAIVTDYAMFILERIEAVADTAGCGDVLASIRSLRREIRGAPQTQ